LKYLPVIWSGIWRKPGRTVLIFLQVSVAFALFGVLQGMKTGGFSFQLAVTPPLAVVGVEWALVMGLLGGLLPALRAARMPIPIALRAT
jgi:ABC-type antimicrobial peptide transport system permease subunit